MHGLFFIFCCAVRRESFCMPRLIYSQCATPPTLTLTQQLHNCTSRRTVVHWFQSAVKRFLRIFHIALLFLHSGKSLDCKWHHWPIITAVIYSRRRRRLNNYTAVSWVITQIIVDRLWCAAALWSKIAPESVPTVISANSCACEH